MLRTDPKRDPYFLQVIDAHPLTLHRYHNELRRETRRPWPNLNQSGGWGISRGCSPFPRPRFASEKVETKRKGWWLRDGTSGESSKDTRIAWSVQARDEEVDNEQSGEHFQMDLEKAELRTEGCVTPETFFSFF